jgi:hypothetical protein
MSPKQETVKNCTSTTHSEIWKPHFKQSFYASLDNTISSLGDEETAEAEDEETGCDAPEPP